MAAEETAAALSGLALAAETITTRVDDGASDAMIDMAIDEQATRITELENAAGDLEDAEALLQSAAYGSEPGVRREGLAAYAAYWLAVIAFAATLNAISDDMLAERMMRDAALARDDIEAAQMHRRNIAASGTRGVETIITKVVPNPINTVVSLNPVGAILVPARDAFNDATTLVATDECRIDPESDDCKFGATTADSETDIEVPAGTLQVAVTGDGLARTVVDVDVAEGERVVLEIDPVRTADLPVEGAGDILHCFGTFGCFDGTSDWVPAECRSEGGTPMPGPCP
ncbi:MAG: hypothetical protein JRH11_12100 [Deltaproteobacteria bacterium]|nr:hypothetical protein [Deltaproteobacteria bacterium]